MFVLCRRHIAVGYGTTAETQLSGSTHARRSSASPSTRGRSRRAHSASVMTQTGEDDVADAKGDRPGNMADGRTTMQNRPMITKSLTIFRDVPRSSNDVSIFSDSNLARERRDRDEHIEHIRRLHALKFHAQLAKLLGDLDVSVSNQFERFRRAKLAENTPQPPAFANLFGVLTDARLPEKFRAGQRGGGNLPEPHRAYIIAFHTVALRCVRCGGERSSVG